MKKNKTKIILGILICTIISMLLLLNISFATSGAVGQAVQTVINGNGTESNPYN